jgi:2-(3-amino-3-carboxypropyl)histidine synthase
MTETNNQTISFDLEENRLIEEVKKQEAKRVLIQLPNGLKSKGPYLSELIEEQTGATVFISSKPCYGGCDLPICTAKAVKADLVVHYGHAPFMTQKEISVVYLSAKAKLDLTQLLKKVQKFLGEPKKIGIGTTIQHLHVLEDFRRSLEDLGHEVMIPSEGRNTRLKGQIIGCDYSSLKHISERVDLFLIIGSSFHGLGAALTLDKPVILADPYSNSVSNMEPYKRKILKQRYAFIEKAKNAKAFGLLLSTKTGQFNLNLTLTLRELLAKAGKTVTMLVDEEIVPEYLTNFTNIEIFVDTACPRLATDDPSRFGKPILTPLEAMVIANKTNWNDLMARGFF